MYIWEPRYDASQLKLVVGISKLKFLTSSLQTFQVHNGKSKEKALLTVTNGFSWA